MRGQAKQMTVVVSSMEYANVRGESFNIEETRNRKKGIFTKSLSYTRIYIGKRTSDGRKLFINVCKGQRRGFNTE